MANIEDTAKRLELKPAYVWELVRFISRKSPTNGQFLRKSGLPKVQAQRILADLKWLLDPPSQIVAIKKGLMETAKDLIIEAKTGPQMKLSELAKNLKPYKDKTPTPLRQYDQVTATTMTTAKRAILMAKNGDLYKRKVAFLGDDDFTSVACGLVSPDTEIDVFEVDSRIIQIIKEANAVKRLRITVHQIDLKKLLPREFISKYDVVFTDPPFTTSGFSLFLNRAIELVKKVQTSRVYISYGGSDRARERELAIQETIAQKGLLINTKIFQFSKYFGAESIGSQSSLYMLDWTPKTKVTKLPDERIYSYE